MTKATPSTRDARGGYAKAASVGFKGVAREAASGHFTVALPQKAVGTLSSHKPQVKAVMRALGVKLDESRISGEPSVFWVEVNPEGDVQIRVAEPKSSRGRVAAQADDDEDPELATALSAARARGQTRAAEILAGDDMLSADALAKLLGVSRPTVNAKRQKHELLALSSARRGFRFPAWQIDENGKPLAALPRLYEQFGDSPWAIYRFLVQRHPELDGDSALKALAAGREDDVLAVAAGQAQGVMS